MMEEMFLIKEEGHETTCEDDLEFGYERHHEDDVKSAKSVYEPIILYPWHFPDLISTQWLCQENIIFRNTIACKGNNSSTDSIIIPQK